MTFLPLWFQPHYEMNIQMQVHVAHKIIAKKKSKLNSNLS